MGKRFISTEIFDDEFIFKLSKDGKLFFLYFITKCDHAGILQLNKELCKFQTGIADIESAINEIGDNIICIKNSTYFMPKFIKFQYPGFPKSNVKQQDSVMKILLKYDLFNEKLNSYLRVNQELINSYVNGNGNDNGNGTSVDWRKNLTPLRR